MLFLGVFHEMRRAAEKEGMQRGRERKRKNRRLDGGLDVREEEEVSD